MFAQKLERRNSVEELGMDGRKTDNEISRNKAGDNEILLANDRDQL
jgi:hypothetical protein